MQQLLCGYLALSLALAGAVGVNPLLHLWIEHGGEGSAHVHWGGGRASAGLCGEESAHPNPHPHAFGHKQPIAPDFRHILVHHGQPFELPGLRSIGRLLSWFLGSDPHGPSNKANKHEHHSLAQLMVKGLVEQPLPFFLPERAGMITGEESTQSHRIRLEFQFDAQAAGRAPPMARS